MFRRDLAKIIAGAGLASLAQTAHAQTPPAKKSSYKVGFGMSATKVWVITEADRASTCLLLPEEY